MAYHRCYFLALGGRLRAGEDIASDTDAKAIARAIEMFGQRAIYDGLEVWKARQRIHAEARQVTLRISRARKRAVLIDDRGVVPGSHTGRVAAGHVID